MNTLIAWVRGNRARASAISVVVIGWLGPAGVPDYIVSGLLTILGILVGTTLVHNAVTPVAKAATAAKVAAQGAALTVAEQLNSHTAGPIGATTEEARAVVDDATRDATDTALRAIGVKRSERAA